MIKLKHNYTNNCYIALFSDFIWSVNVALYHTHESDDRNESRDWKVWWTIWRSRRVNSWYLTRWVFFEIKNQISANIWSKWLMVFFGMEIFGLPGNSNSVLTRDQNSKFWKNLLIFWFRIVGLCIIFQSDFTYRKRMRWGNDLMKE